MDGPIVNMCDNGRIMYASEGITWLLGHVPNTLVDRNVSIYDIMADEDINNFKAALNDKISEADEVINLKKTNYYRALMFCSKISFR